MESLYQFLEDQLDKNYQRLTVLKERDGKRIEQVRHKESDRSFVVRRFEGSIDCYKKLLSVQSPYLPVIYEAAQENGRALVLEEYIAGDSISQMLADARFTEEETRRICRDVCRALYTLHQLGIVNRDVKPSNILLRNEGAVLLDMDAARTMKLDKSRDTRVLGTTGFAAPEQYGISQTDGRADIYALGVTMNLMLTGKHPSIQLAEGRFGHIISKCTMVHPNRRYASILKLMEVLG